MSNTIKAKIANAKRPERIVFLNLRGDLIAEIEDLDTQLRELQQKDSGDRRLAENPAVADIVAQIDELTAEAEDSELELRLRALRGSDWRDAIAQNPPTDEQKEEGYVADTAATAEYVLRHYRDQAVVSPELDDEDVEALLEALAASQLREIESTVWQLNGGDNKVPFSRLASLVRPNSDDEPKSPDGGE